MLALPRDKDGAAHLRALRYSASNNENFCASPFASFTRRNAYASACFSRSFACRARSEQHRCTRPSLVDRCLLFLLRLIDVIESA